MSFNAVTYTPNACTSRIQYDVTFSDGTTFPKGFGTFDSTTRNFSIYTANITYAADYTITIKATLLDSVYLENVSWKWKLTIASTLAAYAISNTAPQFSLDLQPQTMYAGDTAVYALPGIKDKELDKVIVIVGLDIAITFTIYKSDMTFSFKPKTSDVGEYKIDIMLQDMNLAQPKSKRYVLSVSVLAPKGGSSIVVEEYKNKTNITMLKLRKGIDNDLRARIKVISSFG